MCHILLERLNGLTINNAKIADNAARFWIRQTVPSVIFITQNSTAATSS